MHMVQPFQDVAARGPHDVVAATVVTTVIINIMLITVISIFIIIVLFPSQEGKMFEWVQTGRFSRTCT